MNFLFNNSSRTNKKEILLQKQAIINDLKSANLTSIEIEALHKNYLFYEQLINKIELNKSLHLICGISLLLSVNTLNFIKSKRTLNFIVSGIIIYEGITFFLNLNERTLIYSQNYKQNKEFEEITNIKI